MKTYIKQIDNKISELIKSNHSFLNFFYEIASFNPIIIGGFIRNVLNNEEVRDIDIVLNTRNKSIIEEIIDKYSLEYTKNSFDGYKINFDDFDVDIWYIENHNAFKKDVYDISVDNLKETTFINYDSLVYDYNNRKVDISYYMDCINSNMIDFVGNYATIVNNEQPFLSIVKILEISYLKNMNISDRVKEYIMKYYNSNKEEFINILKKEYSRHYNCVMPIDLEEYINNLMNNEEEIKKYVKI